MTSDEAAIPVPSPNDPAIARVEEEFGLLFHRVRNSFREGAQNVHPQLQPVGFKILAHLVRGGPAHAGVIAEQLQSDKSVVSRQVRALEALGLVESRPDPSDGRARLLVATPLAVEKVMQVRTTRQARLYDRLRAWPEADVLKLAELLGRLRD